MKLSLLTLQQHRPGRRKGRCLPSRLSNRMRHLLGGLLSARDQVSPRLQQKYRRAQRRRQFEHDLPRDLRRHQGGYNKQTLLPDPASCSLYSRRWRIHQCPTTAAVPERIAFLLRVGPERIEKAELQASNTELTLLDVQNSTLLGRHRLRSRRYLPIIRHLGQCLQRRRRRLLLHTHTIDRTHQQGFRLVYSRFTR